jgi:hypothetical protein
VPKALGEEDMKSWMAIIWSAIEAQLIGIEASSEREFKETSTSRSTSYVDARQSVTRADSFGPTSPTIQEVTDEMILKSPRLSHVSQEDSRHSRTSVRSSQYGSKDDTRISRSSRQGNQLELPGAGNSLNIVTDNQSDLQSAARSSHPRTPRRSSRSLKQILYEVKSGNQNCADCGEANPEWASINLGILICIGKILFDYI